MQESDIKKIVEKVIFELQNQSQTSNTFNKKNPSGAKDLAPFIDHTLLKPDANRQDIINLCREAEKYKFASVCVNPCWVKLCSETLGAKVKICSVVGFPLGANTTCIKVEETKRAISDGASEIDMVVNIGKLLSGDLAGVYNDVHRIVEAAGTAIVKVIIETCLLSDEQKIIVCTIAKQAGAHYIKTSTGFSSAGATIEDIKLLRQIVGPNMGIKASGGIKDVQTALSLIQAGANRIGTSSGVSLINAG